MHKGDVILPHHTLPPSPCHSLVPGPSDCLVQGACASQSEISEKQPPGTGSHGEVELHLGTGSSLDRGGAGGPGWRVGRLSPSLKVQEAGALTSEGRRGSLQLRERRIDAHPWGGHLCLGPLAHPLFCLETARDACAEEGLWSGRWRSPHPVRTRTAHHLTLP